MRWNGHIELIMWTDIRPVLLSFTTTAQNKSPLATIPLRFHTFLAVPAALQDK